MIRAFELLHEGAGAGGTDVAYPTTVFVDGEGKSRWTYRPKSLTKRLPHEEFMGALDETFGSTGS